MTAQTDQAEANAGRIVISVDVMGGGEGPAPIIAGCDTSARKNSDLHFIFHVILYSVTSSPT